MLILLGVFLSLLASGFSTAVYAWLVWWLDRYEKEPWWLLCTVFLWGAVPAVLLSLLAEMIFDVPISLLGQGLAYEVAGGSLIAPVVEELAKGLAVFGVCLFVLHEMDSVLDGIVYGAMAGLGFALTENVFYFVGSLVEDGWGAWTMVVFMRAVMFGLNHAFFTGLTGASLGYARMSRSRLVRLTLPLAGLTAAILFHAIHNLGSSLSSVSCFSLFISLIADWGGILMLGVVIGLTWRQEREWIRNQLASEVGVTLRQDVYELLISHSRRTRKQLRTLLYGDTYAVRLFRQLNQAATDLAFKKYQLARLGEEGQTQENIDRLRREVVDLQDRLISLPSSQSA